MTLDSTLVQAWNAYPRYVYRPGKGFLSRATGKPFQPPEPPPSSTDQPPLDPDFPYENELEFAAATNRVFPLLLIGPGLFARLKTGGYSSERLAQLVGQAFGHRVRPERLQEWLGWQPAYRAAQAARARRAAKTVVTA